MQSTKILFLTNNLQALDLYNWIKIQDNTECKLLQEKIHLTDFDKFKPDLIISYGYRYIIKKDVIENYQGKIINLHISYLPWNKGADPNIWSFLEDTKKGVTIHLIDENIDTGDILFQREVFFIEKNETLASSYNKLQDEIQKLFKENWKRIQKFNYKLTVQSLKGSIHYLKDFKEISFLIEDKGWETPISELKNSYQDYLQKDANI